MLIPSSADMVQLTYEVWMQARKVEQKCIQREQLVLTNNALMAARKRVTRLIKRYCDGDMRHDERDEGALGVIANWAMEHWERLGGTTNEFKIDSSKLDGRKQPRPRGNPFRPTAIEVGGSVQYVTFKADGTPL